VIDVSVDDKPCEGGVTVQHIGGHCNLHYQPLTWCVIQLHVVFVPTVSFQSRHSTECHVSTGQSQSFSDHGPQSLSLNWTLLGSFVRSFLITLPWWSMLVDRYCTDTASISKMPDTYKLPLDTANCQSRLHSQ